MFRLQYTRGNRVPEDIWLGCYFYAQVKFRFMPVFQLSDLDNSNFRKNRFFSLSQKRHGPKTLLVTLKGEYRSVVKRLKDICVDMLHNTYRPSNFTCPT